MNKPDKPENPYNILAPFRNKVSVFGLILFLAAFSVALPLILIDILFAHANPYAGILMYLLLPLLAVVGVIIVIGGAVIHAVRLSRNPDLPPLSFPQIDLNSTKHRIWAFAILAGTVIFVLISSTTAYRAYQFSDSVQFCGETCHHVMKPEYTAYQHSPHARVACVSCHIGAGAGWFVRSKISGSYQVYSVLFGKYHRPIETPIENLRPAQDTCEQCHWPAKFFGAQQKTFTHFLSDETNSPWVIQALIKIGGGDPKNGLATGIHWHMNISKQIIFKDVDGKRTEIPWVQSIAPDGTVTEYVSSETSLSAEELGKLPHRHMDCMDCHNRPAHIFSPPSQALDQAFAAGLMDVSLPFLKREAVRVLSGTYKSEEEGKDAIERELNDFYKMNYPTVFSERKGQVASAIKTVQSVFSRSVFPEMKADWRSYPNHVGHLTADGCFRCHDGLHVSAEGKVITKDCNACHTILAQGSPADVGKARLEAQPFRHPADIGMDVTEMKCTMCHSVAPENEESPAE